MRERCKSDWMGGWRGCAQRWVCAEKISRAREIHGGLVSERAGDMSIRLNHRQHTSTFTPRTARLPIATHYPLPTAHCPLPTAHGPLPTAHGPLPTALSIATYIRGRAVKNVENVRVVGEDEGEKETSTGERSGGGVKKSKEFPLLATRRTFFCEKQRGKALQRTSKSKTEMRRAGRG